jgi:Tol biopolymer transport system component/DNA-binding winged helix-turn-helix (wHTH) protein
MSMLEETSRLAFGLFEADLSSGELWKNGIRVKIQAQPFRILAMLLEKSGQVVTREELQQRLWGKKTNVDFDQSLGTAINKIREALGDSADNPRFVETLARRGYRFIAPVGAADPKPQSAPLTTAIAKLGSELSGPVESENSRAPKLSLFFLALHRYLAWATVAVIVVSGVTLELGYLIGSREHRFAALPMHIVTDGGKIISASNELESFPGVVTDGANLFTTAIEGGHSSLVRVSLAGGTIQTITVPDEVAGPELGDISPDRTTLLVHNHLSSKSEQPLWLVPVAGGSAWRVANIYAHDGTWMPDGGSILYAVENKLAVINLRDGSSRPFATLPGRAFWLRWSPDGKTLRFTLLNPSTHLESLWELQADDHTPHPLLVSKRPSKEWNDTENCCGVWTLDGSSFIFESIRNDGSDIWGLHGKNTSSPEQLTNGPLTYAQPVAARTGQLVFFIGVNVRPKVDLYDPSKKQFQLTPPFLQDARHVDLSRDRKWVAWIDTAGRLWRARVDGTERLQLTSDPLHAFLSSWSPDGSQLAVMAREPGRPWQIYLVGADGEALKPIVQKRWNVADPTWSPDGKALAFGHTLDQLGMDSDPKTIQVLDLQTGLIRVLPQSEGLFSPRWSPDGKYIAAMSIDQTHLALFDTSNSQWKTLLQEPSLTHPVWSADGRSLYVYDYVGVRKPIYRVSVPNGLVDEVFALADFPAAGTMDYLFCGLMPNDQLVMRTRLTGDLYSLDLSNR